MSIAENVALVRQNIAMAAEEAGRKAEDITLVAASKMNGTAEVRLAFDAGIRVFGENKVQEYLTKSAENAYDGAEIHIIGHLQQNKVKYVAGKVDLIQSVDSVELLNELEKRCEKLGVQQNILLEVNLAGESSKTGCPRDMLDGLLECAESKKAVHVTGLMGMAPLGRTALENRAFFAQMRELFVDIRSKKYDNIKMSELSMGMSGDYLDAIREGATMVRVGTAIFGARNYGTLQ